MPLPTDILLTGDRSFEVDGNGDLKVTTGDDLIKQDPVVQLLNETDPALGSGFTDVFIREFEGDIESALQRSEYVSPPFDVEIVSVDGTQITVNVSTGDMEYQTTFE